MPPQTCEEDPLASVSNASTSPNFVWRLIYCGKVTISFFAAVFGFLPATVSPCIVQSFFKPHYTKSSAQLHYETADLFLLLE